MVLHRWFISVLSAIAMAHDSALYKCNVDIDIDISLTSRMTRAAALLQAWSPRITSLN